MDASLLDDVRRGDPRAWRAFVDEYEGRVAATVVGMLGAGPDADDVGQEVFVRFYRQREQFRGDADVGTYLVRTAMNLSLNALRSRKRAFRWFGGGSREADLVAAPERADEAVEAADLAARVSAAIRRLKADHRAVVVLRLVQEYSTQETAELLGIPAGTVMSRLSRAQTALRKQLVAEGLHG